ncbi:disulfide isomerase [Helicobacter didelphidarum]|uniref:Disulfide isomerase n=1 Tax=Helicobacter didelphidarum TaxID=2040648 RepID=A0A3D8ILU7_9HELI|nr:disulfide isomerase [Helicobacter didelphidarum]RDU66247.1 disulfide isomerase [Helicobacter didelphidarum]
MNKILSVLLLGFFCNFAYASKITDIITKQVGVKVGVIKEQSLNADSNLKLITVKDEEHGVKANFLVNQKENIAIGLSPVVFTDNNKDRELIIREMQSVQSYNDTYKTHASVKKIVDSLPKDYIVYIKGKTNKKVFYIISDPLCPHCQVELANIDKRLEYGDVAMIPIGWMGKGSADKVAEIYANAKNLKTDSEKIAFLKKIYDKNYKAKDADSVARTAVSEVVRQLMGKGKVEGTPYIIEEDK